MIKCIICGLYLPEYFFKKNTRKKNKINLYCVNCKKEYRKKYQKRYLKSYKRKKNEKYYIWIREYYLKISKTSKYKEYHKKYQKEYQKKYTKPKKYAESAKRYRIKNKNKIKQYNKMWRKKNKYKIIEYRRKHKELMTEYQKIKCRKARSEWSKKKLHTDINYKIQRLLRERLRVAIKNGSKRGSAVRDLGCSINFFKKHMEKKFEKGMSWDNWSRDGWHIDHIVPLCSFDLSKKEEVKKACHYTNLQPLWALKNIKKGGRT